MAYGPHEKGRIHSCGWDESPPCLQTGSPRVRAAEQVQIAVMLRTDVYREGRARKLNAIPGKVELFRIVNAETAKHLAETLFPLPDLAAVLAER